MKRYIRSNTWNQFNLTTDRAEALDNIQFNISPEDAKLLAVGDPIEHLPLLKLPASSKPQIVQVDYLDDNKISQYESKYNTDIYKGFVITYDDGHKANYAYVPYYYNDRIVEYQLKYLR